MTVQTDNRPAFPQPDDPSAVIWLYMDAPKFEWLVNCARLFMPNADRLGEPARLRVQHAHGSSH